MKQSARELWHWVAVDAPAPADKATRPSLPEAVAGEGAQVSPLLFLTRMRLLLLGLGANDAEQLVQPGPTCREGNEGG